MQAWMLVRMAGALLLCATVSGVFLYFYAHQRIEDSFYDVHLQLENISDLLFTIIVSGAVLSFLAALVVVIFIPQKIAGPVYRMEEDLKLVRNGDLQKRIKLRKNDPMQDLATAINKTVSVLVERIEKAEKG
jgi:nitrogen fixation/metabolism regulation signal transduction histidine kinase